MKRLVVVALLAILLLPQGASATPLSEEGLVIDYFTVSTIVKTLETHTLSDPTILCGRDRTIVLDDAPSTYLVIADTIEDTQAGYDVTANPGELRYVNQNDVAGNRQGTATIVYNLWCKTSDPVELDLQVIEGEVTVWVGNTVVNVTPDDGRKTVTGFHQLGLDFVVRILAQPETDVVLFPPRAITSTGVDEIEVVLSAESSCCILLLADSTALPGGSIGYDFSFGAHFYLPIRWMGGPGNWGANVYTFAGYASTPLKLALESESYNTLIPESSVPTWQAYSTPTEQGWQRTY